MTKQFLSFNNNVLIINWFPGDSFLAFIYLNFIHGRVFCKLFFRFTPLRIRMRCLNTWFSKHRECHFFQIHQKMWIQHFLPYSVSSPQYRWRLDFNLTMTMNYKPISVILHTLLIFHPPSPPHDTDGGLVVYLISRTSELLTITERNY